MSKYRKKPVVIEAMKFEGSIFGMTDEFRSFLGDANYSFAIKGEDKNCLFIETLEGEMKASPGDYIIKGVAGEFYPCKNEIFLATYEKVEDNG